LNTLAIPRHTSMLAPETLASEAARRILFRRSPLS
jgi:hypothetical protein